LKKYRTIFFDLDHTLWDFEKNSAETLHELFHDNNLAERVGVSAEVFITRYKTINYEMWEAYRKGDLNKELLRTERFRKAFAEFDFHDQEILDIFSSEYVEKSPEKTHLFPHANEVLDYLHGEYKMLIITNGFEEVQHRKLHNCGLKKYFSEVITSEKAGARKPHADIYLYAMAVSESRAHQSIMIGDEPMIDLLGAQNLGMDQVYFDPHNEKIPFDSTYRINSLLELKRIL
jgi:putative hydrolase of the HAD superfamily